MDRPGRDVRVMLRRHHRLLDRRKVTALTRSMPEEILSVTLEAGLSPAMFGSTPQR
jgi:hypothetical protein